MPRKKPSSNFEQVRNITNGSITACFSPSNSKPRQSKMNIMKNHIPYLAAAAAVMIAAPAGRAQDRPGVVYPMSPVPFYVSGQIGGELMEGLTFKDFGAAKHAVEPGFGARDAIAPDFAG